MHNYVNLEEIQTFIEIKSQIARKWLYKLNFKYKNSKKDIFIKRDEHSNIVKNCQNILGIIKDLELYLIKFKKDESIKTKNCPDDYTVENNISRFVIVIIYDR